MLIAIESINEHGTGSYLLINPGKNFKVEKGTRGFFIAGSSDEKKRQVIFYVEFMFQVQLLMFVRLEHFIIASFAIKMLLI